MSTFIWARVAHGVPGLPGIGLYRGYVTTKVIPSDSRASRKFQGMFKGRPGGSKGKYELHGLGCLCLRCWSEGLGPKSPKGPELVNNK